MFRDRTVPVDELVGILCALTGIALDHVYTEQPDHSFRFNDVPIGRYLLEFNPDGPQSGQLADRRFETTFYPQGTSRLQVKA